MQPRRVDTLARSRHQNGHRGEPFKHAVSLGLRCVTAKIFQDAGLRRYATPFDWIFCNLEMVAQCIRDDCEELLKRDAYWEVATIEDVVRGQNAIADLTPRGIHARGAERGKPEARTRVLIGHKTFSPMQKGVGKEVIFNHVNPMEDVGYTQVVRQAERFRRVLDLHAERKLFVVANINWQLWDMKELETVFAELSKRSSNFTLLAVNCVRHKGEEARGSEPWEVLQRSLPARGAELRVFELWCVDNCTGAHFVERDDADRFRELVVGAYDFDLRDGDPLEYDCGTAVLASVASSATYGDSEQGASENVGAPLAVETAAPRRRWGHRAAPAAAKTQGASTDATCAVQQGALSASAETSDVVQRQSALPVDATLRLRRGASMPRFGLGTWLSASGGSCRDACLAAFAAGYRLIDTAQAYRNEGDVGEALRQAGLSRGDVFVVTKLQSKKHGNIHQVRAALEESLRHLQLNYVDLVLIHSPRGGQILETYRALLSLRHEGLCKAVGVSNFGVDHLRGLLDAGLEAPEVNQIELHCWLQQRETVMFCKQHDIAVMAYSPLARAEMFGRTALKEVAERLGRTEAQIAIRWAVQQKFVVIPKSVTPDRIVSNAMALAGPDLAPEDMATIAELDKYQHASCAPASSAMKIPWAEVALATPAGKNGARQKGAAGKGTNRANGKGKGSYVVRDSGGKGASSSSSRWSNTVAMLS